MNTTRVIPSRPVAPRSQNVGRRPNGLHLGNPTLGSLHWAALPFALTATGTIDRNKHTATSDGTLNLYVEAKSAKAFYFVSFRVPGANTGTP